MIRGMQAEVEEDGNTIYSFMILRKQDIQLKYIMRY